MAPFEIQSMSQGRAATLSGAWGRTKVSGPGGGLVVP